MTDERSVPPAWFRVAGSVLLIWDVIGCYFCVQQFRLGADAMGPSTGYDRMLYADLPVWYNAVYAVAVGTGALGAAALIGRSVLARPLFAISLVAIVVQFGWLFATTDIVVVKGAATVLPFPIFIVAVSVAACWLADRAARRGWIG